MNVTPTTNWMDMEDDSALKMVPGHPKHHSAKVNPAKKDNPI